MVAASAATMGFGRVDRAVTRSAPHRSGRARFTHPAPRQAGFTEGSRPSRRLHICRRRGDTVSRASEYPAWFPPASPAADKPFAPPGPLDVHVPRLHRYYDLLRLPILVLRTSMCSLRCTTSVPVGSLHASTATLRLQARRIRVRLLHGRDCWWKESGLPGSWTTPMSACPALRPRRDRVLPANTARPCSLPLPQERRLPRIRCFAAPSHGLLTHCLRFTLPVTGPGARLASGWSPTFAGWEFHPLGCTTQFLQLSLLSKRPDLPGALRPNVRANLKFQDFVVTRMDLTPREP